MAVIGCAHCGSGDTQAQVDTVQCLACGLQTDLHGEPRLAPILFTAPGPAAQRIMHAPGGNDGVDSSTLQVGEAVWSSDEDPVGVEV